MTAPQASPVTQGQAALQYEIDRIREAKHRLPAEWFDATQPAQSSEEEAYRRGWIECALQDAPKPDAEALNAELVEALRAMLPIVQEQSEIGGYGFYRPSNPNDFSPDHESCSAEEIAAHRAACEAYDRGEFTPDKSDGWVGPNLHILKAPWGIGSYTETVPEIKAICDAARAALLKAEGAKP